MPSATIWSLLSICARHRNAWILYAAIKFVSATFERELYDDVRSRRWLHNIEIYAHSAQINALVVRKPAYSSKFSSENFDALSGRACIFHIAIFRTAQCTPGECIWQRRVLTSWFYHSVICVIVNRWSGAEVRQANNIATNPVQCQAYEWRFLLSGYCCAVGNNAPPNKRYSDGRRAANRTHHSVIYQYLSLSARQRFSFGARSLYHGLLMLIRGWKSRSAMKGAD